MSGSDLGYWALWLVGALLIGLCLSVTWWGLFGDRARGSRRCPRCWYDLSHTSGMTCSECGHCATRERSLHRTRRRLVPAMLAALAASVGMAWTIESAQEDGWVSLLPTRVILMSLPFASDADNGLIDELSGRIGRDKLTNSQWRSLIHRCAGGDWWARPITKKWREKYGVLLDQAQSRLPDGLGLDQVLNDVPAWVEIDPRHPWPKGTAVCLELSVREWWPQQTVCRVRLQPTWAGGEPITVVRSGAHRGRRRFPLTVNTPPPASPLRFEVRVERPRPDQVDAWETTQQQTISVPLELIESLSEALHPVSDERIDRAVMASFRHGVVKWTSGRSPVRVRYDPRPTFGGKFEDTSVGVSVELLHDGQLARRLDIWWLAGAAPPDRGTGWLVVYEDEQRLGQANATDGRWQMRVRGDPLVALRAGAASKFWAGEFTIPLVVNERDTSAPPKRWRIEASE